MTTLERTDHTATSSTVPVIREITMDEAMRAAEARRIKVCCMGLHRGCGDGDYSEDHFTMIDSREWERIMTLLRKTESYELGIFETSSVWPMPDDQITTEDLRRAVERATERKADETNPGDLNAAIILYLAAVGVKMNTDENRHDPKVKAVLIE